MLGDPAWWGWGAGEQASGCVGGLWPMHPPICLQQGAGAGATGKETGEGGVFGPHGTAESTALSL